MKRFLLCLLACCLLFSLVACSDSDNDDTEKNMGDKDVTDSEKPGKQESTTDSTEHTDSGQNSKDDFVGEWFMFEGTYGADGKIVSVEFVCLELEEDGSASYQDQKGIWKYRRKQNVVEIKLEDITMECMVVDVEGYVGLQVYDHIGLASYLNTFLQENATLKSQIMEALSGDWYSYNSDKNQFSTLTFQDDGSMLYQGEMLDRRWSLLSVGPYVFLEYGDTFPLVLDLDSMALPMYVDNIAGTYYHEDVCIVVTPENWHEYFGENLEDNFEITYTVEPVYDDWGEVSSFYVRSHIRLPDFERYNDQSFLTVEYLNDGIGDYVTVDPDSFEVTVKQDKAFVYGETITITISKQFYDFEFEYTERLLTYEDFTVMFVFHGKITRMRGLLIENP